MASWMNLCLIIIGSAVQHCCCQHSWNVPDSLEPSKRAALPITRTNSVVNTSGRFIRSKSQRTKQVADLVMIMDISASLSKQDLQYQRGALRGLSQSKAIDIGKNNVRIGIVAFETWAHMILPLDKGISRKAIYDAATEVDHNKFPKNGSGFASNFPDAMDMAKEQLANGRKVLKVAILATHGGENCLPSQVVLHKPCADHGDCNYIAEHCPRPPRGQDICDCNTYRARHMLCVRSAVFGEFAQLRKAGGAEITLAIIGVGWNISQQGRERLNCWATERMYQELQSYSQLEKTVERLVTTILPVDPDDDCMSTYYTKEGCHVDDHKRCGRHYYINITQNTTGSGRPCPEQKIWRPCRYRECGMTLGQADHTPVPEVAHAPNDVNNDEKYIPENKHEPNVLIVSLIVMAIIVLIIITAAVVLGVLLWEKEEAHTGDDDEERELARDSLVASHVPSSIVQDDIEEESE